MCVCIIIHPRELYRIVLGIVTYSILFHLKGLRWDSEICHQWMEPEPTQLYQVCISYEFTKKGIWNGSLPYQKVRNSYLWNPLESSGSMFQSRFHSKSASSSGARAVLNGPGARRSCCNAASNPPSAAIRRSRRHRELRRNSALGCNETAPELSVAKTEHPNRAT